MSTVSSPLLSPAQVNQVEFSQWRQAVKDALNDTRCATVAFVAPNGFDAATQTVSVQIALQERVRTTAGPKWIPIVPINRVPLILPRAGGYCLTMPINPGDEGLLVFCDTCFDTWWASGQSSSPTGTNQQRVVRRHHIHDCGFIPGMWNQTRLLPSYSTTAMQLRTDDGTVAVTVSSNAVSISAPSSVTITSPSIHATNGGTAQALMNDTFYQWYVTNVQPFLVSKGYLGPAPPIASLAETTVLKGQ